MGLVRIPAAVLLHFCNAGGGVYVISEASCNDARISFAHCTFDSNIAFGERLGYRYGGVFFRNSGMMGHHHDVPTFAICGVIALR